MTAASMSLEIGHPAAVVVVPVAPPLPVDS